MVLIKECLLFQGGTDQKRENILIVTTYQMVILLLFNQRDRITFREILRDTEIPEREATRALQALALGKLNNRILTKTPKTKEIGTFHSFYYIYI